jgi:hypothetical protein
MFLLDDSPVGKRSPDSRASHSAILYVEVAK